MDLLTYKELDTGPDAPKNPSMGYRAWHWLLSLSPTAVTFMVALSIGLGMVGAQVSSLPVLILMSIFWGATVVAMVGVVARWFTPGRGRHRMAS
ncbi:hypothetical protein F7Q99_02195 [Streptomyces kaniharaensis]|uniref:Uncharacterized protein n=1 Tax=Streptomyces kaniharaensis TaxID=212423 RepID=A0A6N7KK47_9ACTN|nr:hypothetical protein [Streptomyces kaniharaensis]MQS11125.1 hypothetical protein [Streptomyces kaniharaensis]